MNLLQFIKYKTFIGHSKKNTPLLSAWLLYSLRGGIWIINLCMTILMFKNIINLIKHLVINNFPIWFINLDRSKEFIINKNAKDCGEFVCSRVWIRGILSNYSNILNCLNSYVLRKLAIKNNIASTLYKKWHITRFTWPRAVFISSLKYNYIVAKEANSMRLPIIALIDTNVKSHVFNFPIVCNDDSIESVSFMCSILSKNIILYKYTKIVLWFYNCRKQLYLNLLNNWLNSFIYIKKKGYIALKGKFQMSLKFFNIIDKGLRFIFKLKKEIYTSDIGHTFNNVNDFFFCNFTFYSHFFVSIWYTKYLKFLNKFSFYNPNSSTNFYFLKNPLKFEHQYEQLKNKMFLPSLDKFYGLNNFSVSDSYAWRIKRQNENFIENNLRTKITYNLFVSYLYFYYINLFKNFMEFFTKNSAMSLSSIRPLFVKKYDYKKDKFKKMFWKFRQKRVFHYIFPLKKWYIVSEKKKKYINFGKLENINGFRVGFLKDKERLKRLIFLYFYLRLIFNILGIENLKFNKKNWKISDK